MSIDDILISADKFPLKVEHWRAYAARAPYINWADAPNDTESTSDHRELTVYTDGSKIGGGVSAGAVIFDDGVLVGEHAYISHLTLQCFRYSLLRS